MVAQTRYDPARLFVKMSSQLCRQGQAGLYVPSIIVRVTFQEQMNNLNKATFKSVTHPLKCWTYISYLKNSIAFSRSNVNLEHPQLSTEEITNPFLLIFPPSTDAYND